MFPHNPFLDYWSASITTVSIILNITAKFYERRLKTMGSRENLVRKLTIAPAK